ncbi:MAG: CBS domain-containing protein [Nanoarchaeota archaeon]|nr:CBS domain-containing protein [Nanoarchaeota archaeon]
MLVEEVMTEDVKKIEETATVEEAAKQMAELKISSLIVSKGDELAGIITDGDIIRNLVAQGKDPTKTKVKNVMTKEVIMVKPDLELSDAIEIMTEKQLKTLPVIDGNRLVGVVTMTDLCSAQPKLVEKFSHAILGKKQKPVAG